MPDLTRINLFVYKTAVQARNMEIRLFWQRSNYFLVLNTAIGIGFFAKEQYAIPVSLFGMSVSVLWLCLNFGSKFWSVRWEQRLYDLERELSPSAQLFAASPDRIRKDVEKGLGFWDDRFWGSDLCRPLVMKKFSVSQMMTILSFLFLVLWIVLAGYSVFGPTEPSPCRMPAPP